MIYRTWKSTLLFAFIILVSCGNQNAKNETLLSQHNLSFDLLTTESIILGANRTEIYLPLIQNKKVGIVGNHTSVIKRKNDPAQLNEKDLYIHLVDSLVSLNINVIKVFAPEHGFRGAEPAGAKIAEGIDEKTGLPLMSLYGKNMKPTPEQLKNVEIMIFDIQDVGTRFYTYISTLHYVMEACAENNIPVLVLDRPNPNGHYIDGPILEPEHRSFVGMDPIPVVHGLTIGEYAKMLNGEKLLKNGIQTDLTVIKMENYDHIRQYDLPLKPSPNLPNSTAVNLYPSLCFFEGTNVNEGRGTSKQFQVFGSPFLDPKFFDYSYMPEPNEGSKDPKHMGVKVYGRDLSDFPRIAQINLDWLIEAYANTADKSKFFREDFFTKLAGTTKLQEQIEAGMSSGEIRKTWKKGLQKYAGIREKYLLY